jgi:hypothetical protein
MNASRSLRLFNPRSLDSRTILFHHAQFRPLSMTRNLDEYKPHLLPIVPGAEVGPDGPHTEHDWTTDLDLEGATTFSKAVWGEKKLKVLVLYGSLRDRYITLHTS